ncbi:MAG: YaaL family protein [Lacrimispora sp.]|uniref:YaaL family protein n=1 Tax=Lacrimispora sp. TaxID=2719234 RepID=UPI0039E2AE4F
MKNGLLKKPLAPSEEEWNLRCEIERSKTAIDAARNHFEQVVDPTLIDCYIYELNAAQLRYQFLLRRFKSREV